MSITLDLKSKYLKPETFRYEIGNEMFESVDNSLVKGGSVVAEVTAESNAAGINLTFQIEGSIVVECDRCLDDMEVDINTEESLNIQFADRYEDADDIVYVPDNDTELDLWPFVYDFVVLSMPLTHTHPEGKCNEEMVNKLKQYMVTSANEPEDEE